MKDGHIVWQARCQHCGWTDPEISIDLDGVKARAAAHLQGHHAPPGQRLEGRGARVVVPDTLGADWTPGQCMALWRDDLACPHDATWRIENTTNEGFCEVCTPHKEGFQALEPAALVRYVSLMGPETLEA